MARAQFRVVVFPYITCGDDMRFALFTEVPATGKPWQGVSGAGWDEETPHEAAQRELFDGIGIMPDAELIQLDARMMIPVVDAGELQCDSDMLLLPEYTFGVSVNQRSLRTTPLFAAVTWQDISSAMNMVASDNSRAALWELYHRVRMKGALPT